MLGVGLFLMSWSAVLIVLAAAPGPVSSFYRLLIGMLLMAGPFGLRARSGLAHAPPAGGGSAGRRVLCRQYSAVVQRCDAGRRGQPHPAVQHRTDLGGIGSGCVFSGAAAGVVLGGLGAGFCRHAFHSGAGCAAQRPPKLGRSTWSGSWLVLRRLSTHHAKGAPKAGHPFILLAFSFCQHHRFAFCKPRLWFATHGVPTCHVFLFFVDGRCGAGGRLLVD